MLNITNNTVQYGDELKNLQSTKHISLSNRHLSMRNLLLVLLGIFLFFMILPWTQNIRTEGRVTTLLPQHRPQTIHATISGRVEKWFVTEGQFVNKGDTIVHLSEVNTAYFDPQLVNRVQDQVEAKEGSINAYGGKVGALEAQIGAMRLELESKISQTLNKIEQARLKVESDSLKVLQAEIDLQVAQRQFEGAKALYDKGLESLTKFEERRLKLQDAQTKRVSAQNQFASSRNDLMIYQTELMLAQNEFANKIAKTEGDKFSTLSESFDARASVNKLMIDRDNYSKRSMFYYIVAPQDCYVVKAITTGLGEIVQEGAPVVSIQPSDYQLAVEMYVKPIDLPLIEKGQKVRFLFDGWPAFFFSGWPGISLGTFGGKIYAVDRNISTNGKFRVLVEQDTSELESWPGPLQVGGGAKGIALLNNVPLWYEMWRVLNGFPADLYTGDASSGEDQGSGLTPKAPIKKAK